MVYQVLGIAADEPQVAVAVVVSAAVTVVVPAAVVADLGAETVGTVDEAVGSVDTAVAEMELVPEDKTFGASSAEAEVAAAELATFLAMEEPAAAESHHIQPQNPVSEPADRRTEALPAPRSVL